MGFPASRLHGNESGELPVGIEKRKLKMASQTIGKETSGLNAGSCALMKRAHTSFVLKCKT